jgi:uncharacterized SAM-dependent methyltransferase
MNRNTTTATTSLADYDTHHKFKNEILNGLSEEPKHLLSKYFYDKKGDELFQQIMNMPEYYLTDCELEIFTRKRMNLQKRYEHSTSLLIWWNSERRCYKILSSA